MRLKNVKGCKQHHIILHTCKLLLFVCLFVYLFIFCLLTAKVDGHWGRWSEWSKCDASCDDGIKKRTRMCNNPEPKHGGKYCPGIGSEEVVCTTRRCNLGEVLISLSIYFSNLNKKIVSIHSKVTEYI